MDISETAREYNDAIEAMRRDEYPVLQGQPPGAHQ